MSRLFTLLLVTFSALVLELALIRWVAGQVRIVAYFPNLILISAFFGMGVGCLRQGKRSFYWAIPTLLLVQTGLVIIGSSIAFSGKTGSEYFWLLYYNLPSDAPVVNNLLIPLWLVFITTTLVFIPFGQQVAEILKACQKDNKTLIGYAFDLGGSLVGVIIFTLLSLLGTFPVIWFAAALIPGCLILRKNLRLCLFYTLPAIGVVFLVNRFELASLYSPYYALNTVADSSISEDEKSNIAVLTNGSLHQIMLPLADEQSPENEYANSARTGFNTPFEHLDFIPENALVLGAGTGNDVSILLKQGVKSIDAVEIDPQIMSIGKRLHPDLPYSSSRVNAIVDDARSFLNKTDKKYDLIVFGTLDSMTRLSALSNVRLDNFVYTKESIEAAKSLLTDRGGIIMHFMVGEAHIKDKITALIVEVFDELPVIHSEHYKLFNNTFLVGPAFRHVEQAERTETAKETFKVFSSAMSIEVPSDDWPYLYLEKRGVGEFYLQVISTVFVSSLLIISLFGGISGNGFNFWRNMDVPMFLFGAAFLVLNTKAVTEIGLVWGNTWMTNAVTFASILFVLLLSTLFFAYRPLPLKTCFAGLFLALVILYVFPLSSLLGLSVPLKTIASAIFIGTPFFFAGACFAGVFKASRDVSNALGWNIIGALCGGLLEYLNMLLGFKALYLLALIFYLIAYLVFNRRSLPQA